MGAAWDKFNKDVDDARERLGNPDPVWYRGHQEVRYELVPSLYRYENGTDKEQVLLKEYVEGGGPGFVGYQFKEYDGELDGDWKNLLDMQHYGIPTRLLDWTDTLAVAVAFAILDREETNQNPATVFVLSPIALNKKANLGEEIIEIRKGRNYKYKDLYWRGNPPPEKPVPLRTPKGYRNERMTAQHAKFTVHGTDMRAMERMFKDVVEKIELPSPALEEAKKFVVSAGCTPEVLFPDIAGLALHIRTKHLKRLAHH